jgi:hypothetical protein
MKSVLIQTVPGDAGFVEQLVIVSVDAVAEVMAPCR